MFRTLSTAIPSAITASSTKVPATMRKAAQLPMPSAIRPYAQGEAENDEHQAAGEGGHADQHRGQADPPYVFAQLALGQLDLVPDQLGHVLGGQGDEIPE